MTILVIILIIVFWKEIVSAVFGFFGLIYALIESLFALIGSLFGGIGNLFDLNRKH